MTLKKKNDISEIQEYPVFAYICNSIGETLDVRRFDTLEDNDFHDAVIKYNAYRRLKNKNNFEEPFSSWFNDDEKLKFIPIEEFDKKKMWKIEGWWNEEEKIAIGLKKESNIMSITEFQDFIEQIAEQMNEYKEVLECLK